MDNLSTLMKDYQIKPMKQRLSRNEMKGGQLGKTSKFNSSKIREKLSQDNLRSEENEKDENIKWKIEDVRQKIRREKLQLKKKFTETTNQS